MKKTIICIVNWNGHKDTVECVLSILSSSSIYYSVVIFDNNSDYGSVDFIKNKFRENNINFELFHEPTDKIKLTHQVNLITSDFNGGFAYANNKIIKIGLNNEFEYFWILNNDTVIEKNALNFLTNKISTNVNLGMVGSMLLYYDNRNTIQALGGVIFSKFSGNGRQVLNGDDVSAVKNNKKYNITYVAGASMLVSRNFLLDVGFMSEDYFLYYEEIDWAIRAKSKKWDIGYCEKSIVYHKEGASIGTNSRGNRSKKSLYYLNRNKIIFYKKFYPRLVLIPILKNIKDSFAYLVKLEFSYLNTSLMAIFDGVVGKVGKKDV